MSLASLPRSGSRSIQNSSLTQNTSPSSRTMALRRRPSFGLKETVSVRHFSASTRGRTAKPAHYSIPTTASDSLIFLSRHRPPRTVLTSPHSLAKLDLKQALFATSASPSLPLTVTGVVELGFTKHMLKIWNSSEIPVQASLLSNYCSATLFPLECANYALDDSPIEAEALDLLDTRFKAIPSLKEIIVNVHV